MRLQTITERVIAEHAREGAVPAGAIATVAPNVLLLNDVSAALAFDQFAAMGKGVRQRLIARPTQQSEGGKERNG